MQLRKESLKKPGFLFATIIIIIIIIIIVNNDLLRHKQAKIIDKNRRFGVFMTPLSR